MLITNIKFSNLKSVLMIITTYTKLKIALSIYQNVHYNPFFDADDVPVSSQVLSLYSDKTPTYSTNFKHSYTTTRQFLPSTSITRRTEPSKVLPDDMPFASPVDHRDNNKTKWIQMCPDTPDVFPTVRDSQLLPPLAAYGSSVDIGEFETSHPSKGLT